MEHKHKLSTLPRWARKIIHDLSLRVRYAEATIPWTKPGMKWFTVIHPNTRAKDDKRTIKLFVLCEDGAQCIVSIGPDDALFVGRGKNESEINNQKYDESIIQDVENNEGSSGL